MKHYVQYTSYKINHETGKAFQWFEGPYSWEKCIAKCEKMNEVHKGKAYTTVRSEK